jgi:uncharacterized integral membrane protein
MTMSDENSNASERHPVVAAGRSGPNPVLIGWAVVVVLFVIFFLQNNKHVKIDFLFFEKNTTIRWSLLVAVLLGVAFDRIFTIWWRRRRRRNNNA